MAPVPKRILLLDDDPDFTGLLTDIFRQSSYVTVSFTDPVAALKALRSEPFDLLITDHRMPGMTGEVLVRELRKTHVEMPVIIVSGFLDNDTIRELVRDGVGGIFLKPLSVVNLLKRTATLLNEADAAGNRLPAENDDDLRHRLPFRFESYPCISPVSAEFARQLHAKRGFKGALTLVVPPGTDLAAIVDDLAKFDPADTTDYITLNTAGLTADRILAALRKSRESGRNITLIFRNPDLASAGERQLVSDLGSRRPPFDTFPPLRLLLTFTRPVDELFEKGGIEEGFYLLASVAEIVAPTLAECPEDIPVIATRHLARHCDASGIRPPLRLHKLARNWLAERPWPGNREELCLCVTRAAGHSQSGLITRESFFRDSDGHQWIGAGISALEIYLGRLRDDYIRATLMLCEDDIVLAAETLGIPPDRILELPPGGHSPVSQDTPAT